MNFGTAYWFKKLAPLFHPIRSKTKTNRDSLVRVFPHFASATCNYLVFWLVHLNICVLCDWLEWLLGFWFYYTQLKTALKMHRMFFVHTTPEEYKDATIWWNRGWGILGQGGENKYTELIFFEKLFFRDGLVRTVGLTVEIKISFQISLAYYLLKHWKRIPIRAVFNWVS